MSHSHRCFLFVAAFSIVSGAVSPLRAASDPALKAYVIADDKTGHILAGQDADKKLQVGSLTKIATAIVVFDWVRTGGHTLDQLVTVSPSALTIGGVNPVGFQPGDQAPLRDLLYAALLQSDNVAAQTLAEYVGSQLPSGEATTVAPPPVITFVAQMNALARTLGMERTRFLNPTGLDSKERPYSTASDLSRLTRHALTKAEFRFFIAQKERRITINRAGQPSEYLLRNTNELLGVSRIDGVKTGQTQLAGSCLIITAARDPIVVQEGTATVTTPRRLIVVVLGASDRFRDAARLLDQGVGLYDQWAAKGRPISPKEKL